MFFEEHEKQIYSPKDQPEKKYDPLALDRALTFASGGKLDELLKQWQAGSDGLGDVSPESVSSNKLCSAQAEEQLAAVARKAFGLPEFPDCLDAEAFDILCDFLEWMEKKGKRGETPQPSPGGSGSEPIGSDTISSSSSS